MDKSSKKRWVISLIIIFIVFIIPSIYILNYCNYCLCKEKKVELLQCLLSLLGILGLCFTIYYTSLSNQNFENQKALQLYLEFMSEKYEKVRSDAWEVRRYCKQNKIGYDVHVREMIEKNKNNRLENSKFNKHNKSALYAVYDIHEFFRMLTVIGFDKETIFRLHAFYYPHWRFFLYSTARVFDEDQYNKFTKEDVSKFGINKDNILKQISYESTLISLDKILGFENLSKNIELFVEDAGEANTNE